MNITLNLKKGYDIKIAGDPGVSPAHAPAIDVTTVALTADDFPGLTLRPLVKEGETLHAGDAVLADKNNPEIKIVSPVDGTVQAVNRGERRKLINVVIEAAKPSDDTPKDNPTADQANGSTATDSLDDPRINPGDDTRATAIKLMNAGEWAMMRQRPYNTVPRSDVRPRDIFVTGFDSYPLAGDITPAIAAHIQLLENGVATLTKLTDGKIYISRRPGTLPDIKGAVMVDVNGPCPASNAGVIAANIRPVNKGETIWCLDAPTLVRIGSLTTGCQRVFTTTVAVAGSEVEHPGFVTVTLGASVGQILNGRLKPGTHHRRIIAGNPFTGHKTTDDGYLRWPYRQLTVIPEGDDTYEFMGWASLSTAKMSSNRSFLGRLLGKKSYNPDARMLGGRRAMIMSGEYERVFPMDILPEYLIKAIMARDIEKMEGLGIYEVAPEDFAVAEHLCSSKMPLQQIVTEGLEYLRKELE